MRSKGRDSGTYVKFLLLRQFLESCVSPQTEGSSLPVRGGQVQGPPGKVGCILSRDRVSGFWEQPEHNKLELEREGCICCDRFTKYPCDLDGCSRAAWRPYVICGGFANPSRGTVGTQCSVTGGAAVSSPVGKSWPTLDDILGMDAGSEWPPQGGTTIPDRSRHWIFSL